MGRADWRRPGELNGDTRASGRSPGPRSHRGLELGPGDRARCADARTGATVLELKAHAEFGWF